MFEVFTNLLIIMNFLVTSALKVFRVKTHYMSIEDNTIVTYGSHVMNVEVNMQT